MNYKTNIQLKEPNGQENETEYIEIESDNNVRVDIIKSPRKKGTNLISDNIRTYEENSAGDRIKLSPNKNMSN